MGGRGIHWRAYAHLGRLGVAQSLWQALFTQLTLFRRLTLELSQALDYEYD